MRYSMLRAVLPVLLAAAVCVAPKAAEAAVSIGISVNVAPPPLPVYVQPPVPAPGYIWTPGYWAWGDGDYYWVPGTWLAPPEVGFLWTPGYWGWGDGSYFWHAGYWGPHVGFYGGVNYGYGYTGVGFQGGYWRDRTFFYNRSVANVRTTNITNVYNKTVVRNVTVNRVSYNGGTGGLSARPTSAEETAARDHHVAFTSDQEKHEHAAAGDRQLRASVNHGRPSVAATARPAVFTGKGVIPTRTSAARVAQHPAAEHSAPRAGSANVAAERTRTERTTAEHATRERASPGRTAPREATGSAGRPNEAHTDRPVTERAPNAHVQEHQMPHRPQEQRPQQRPQGNNQGNEERRSN